MPSAGDGEGFGQAHAQLLDIAARLAEEHVREVAELAAQVSNLNQQLLDLKGEPASVGKSGSLVPSPRRHESGGSGPSSSSDAAAITPLPSLEEGRPSCPRTHWHTAYRKITTEQAIASAIRHCRNHYSIRDAWIPDTGKQLRMRDLENEVQRASVIEVERPRTTNQVPRMIMQAMQAPQALGTCPHCGNTYREDSKFCRICGKPRVEAHGWVGEDNGLRAFVHPESRVRVFWDLFVSVLLCYDAVFIPLQLFEMPCSTFCLLMDVFGAIVWPIDLALTCFTGVHIDGLLELRVKFIVFQYAKTYLLLDVVLILLEWVVLIRRNSTEDAVVSISFLRSVRFLRCCRLLRLVRLRRIWNNFRLMVNSIVILLCLSVLQRICILFLINHIIAGVWYWLGRGTDRGWVQHYLPNDATLKESYFRSMQWSLAQFQGETDTMPVTVDERVFNVCVSINAIMLLAWLLSSMTTAMMENRAFHKDKTENHALLCNFLRHHSISTSLTVRMKKVLAGKNEAGGEQYPREKSVPVLMMMPRHLMMEMHEEYRGPTMAKHRFFLYVSNRYPAGMRQICHEGLEEGTCEVSEVMFKRGDACDSMMFLHDAEMMYQGQQVHQEADPRIATETVVCDGQWLSEAALWTEWHHLGNLTATRYGMYFRLSAKDLARITGLYILLYVKTVKYAEAFIEKLNKTVGSDLLDPSFSWRLNLHLEQEMEKGDEIKAITQAQDRTPASSLPKKIGKTKSITKPFSECEVPAELVLLNGCQANAAPNSEIVPVGMNLSAPVPDPLPPQRAVCFDLSLEEATPADPSSCGRYAEDSSPDDAGSAHDCSSAEEMRPPPHVAKAKPACKSSKSGGGSENTLGSDKPFRKVADAPPPAKPKATKKKNHSNTPSKTE